MAFSRLSEVDKLFLYLHFLKINLEKTAMHDLIQFFEAEYSKQRKSLPSFKAGDTINVHVKIKEGNKERIQQFQGVVMRRRGKSTNGETFTVRKVSNGVGVERIFPICSPSIANIEVKRRGAVRRAKLYYLRGKQGKAAKVKEKRIVASSKGTV